MDNEIKKELKKFPKLQRQEFEKRRNNSLNAHNAHNTANSVIGQELDIIEKRALEDGEDKTIIRSVK